MCVICVQLTSCFSLVTSPKCAVVCLQKLPVLLTGLIQHVTSQEMSICAIKNQNPYEWACNHFFFLPSASVLHFPPKFTMPQKSESCLSPALLLGRHIRTSCSIVLLSEGLCVGPLKILHEQISLWREAFSDPEQV